MRKGLSHLDEEDRKNIVKEKLNQVLSNNYMQNILNALGIANIRIESIYNSQNPSGKATVKGNIIGFPGQNNSSVIDIIRDKKMK